MNFIFVILVTSLAKVRAHSTLTLSELEQRLHHISDSQMFLVIPVQRPMEVRQKEVNRLVVEAAQVIDSGTAAIQQDVGISAERTMGGDKNSFKAESLDEVFLKHEEYPPVTFSMQVPMVLPFDFHFKHDVDKAPPPACTTDARTWRENTITRIMNVLGLPGADTLTWNYGGSQDVISKLRLKKDILATMWEIDLQDTDAVDAFITEMRQCENEARTLCNPFIQATIRVQVNPDNLPLLALCTHTYQSLQECSSLVRDALAIINDQAYDDTQLDIIETLVTTALEGIPPVP